MQCKFMVGQKVLCIDGDGNVITGNVYTVSKVHPEAVNLDGTICRVPCLEFKEMMPTYCWEYTLFRALDDKLLEPFREYCRTREDALHDLLCDYGYGVSPADTHNMRVVREQVRRMLDGL